MSPLSQDISAAVLAACQTNATESGSSLGRCFGGDYRLSPQEVLPLAEVLSGTDLAKPGLALVLPVGDLTAAVLIPEEAGLLPDWISTPDQTGKSKLTTLAQELGMCLLPEECMPDDFRAVRVSNLLESITAAEASEGALCLPHKLTLGEITSTLWMIWPLVAGKNIVAAPVAEAAPEMATSPVAPAVAEEPTLATSAAAPAPATAPPGKATVVRKQFSNIEEGLPILPPYTRSLLKIKVPVRVVLAEATLPVSRIVELAQGSIIPFEKSCEEMLTLDVGDCHVAIGEAVKVGDKFGIRISAISLPEEKFWTVRGKKATTAKAG